MYFRSLEISHGMDENVVTKTREYSLEVLFLKFDKTSFYLAGGLRVSQPLPSFLSLIRALGTKSSNGKFIKRRRYRLIALNRTPDRWPVEDLYKAFDTGTTKGCLFGIIIGDYTLTYTVEKSYVYARYTLYGNTKNVNQFNGYTIFQGYDSVPIPNGSWKGEYYELIRERNTPYKVQTYAGVICDTEFGTVTFVPGTGIVHTNPMRGYNVKADDLFGSFYELYYIQDSNDTFPVLSLGKIRIENDADYRKVQARRSQLRWCDLDDEPRTWDEFETEFKDWNDVYLCGPGLENH